MDRKYAYYVFVGLAIGVMFGLIWARGGNASLGILYGGLVGAAIGWFIAAARSQSTKDKEKTGKQ